MRSRMIQGITFATTLLVANGAHAVPLIGGVNVFEDDNIEYVLDANGDQKTSGDLTVGDRLRTVVTFASQQDISTNEIRSLGAPGLELTGISELEITAIDDQTQTFTFGASSDFEATYGTGALAALFTEDPGDFSISCHNTSVAECETTATNGSPYLVAGFDDPDDFWLANGVLPGIDFGSIDGVAGLSPTTKVGAANFALSVLENNTGRELSQQFNPLSLTFAPGGGDDGFVDIIGSGDILGGQGLTSPFFARSDFDFQVKAVPTPGTVVLLGLGLVGIAAARRRWTSV